jgi:hypothetical protein
MNELGDDRFVVHTRSAAIIHETRDGSECLTRRPADECSCGFYRIAWESPEKDQHGHDTRG